MKLAPCPFCGATEDQLIRGTTPCVNVHRIGHAWFRVVCESCCTGGPFADTEIGASQKWVGIDRPKELESLSSSVQSRTFNVKFFRDQKEIGCLDFSKDPIKFTGEVDESAKLFFESVAKIKSKSDTKEALRRLLESPFPHDLLEIRRNVQDDFGGDDELAKAELDVWCAQEFCDAQLKAHHDAVKLAREVLEEKVNRENRIHIIQSVEISAGRTFTEAHC